MPFRRSPVRGLFGLALIGCCALLLAACTGGPELPASTLDVKGDHARRIYDLLLPLFWAGLGVFVIVEALLVYSVFRYRQRPNSGIPAQIHGNMRIEILWTIAPALILLVISVLTFQTQRANSVQPEDALRVEVIGHQWFFEFRYPQGDEDPGNDVVTGGDLYIPVGRPVRLEMTGFDVIHNFWVPKLAGKTDMIPGKENLLSFTADEPGVYWGQCAEFCGEQHALMRFRVVAVEPDRFERWLAAQGTPPAVTGDAERGVELFRTKACISCHVIDGHPATPQNPPPTGGNATQGPNLTYFGSRNTIAAGVLPNTPENLALWLRNPEAVKPGNKMSQIIRPGFLNEQEIADLVAYLDGMRNPEGVTEPLK